MGKLKRDFLDRLILSFLLERGVKFLERPARITENLKRRDKKKRNSQKNLYNASDMTKKNCEKRTRISQHVQQTRGPPAFPLCTYSV